MWTPTTGFSIVTIANCHHQKPYMKLDIRNYYHLSYPSSNGIIQIFYGQMNRIALKITK